MTRRLAAVAVATLLVTSSDVTAQTRRPPPPQGNRIPAQDGDVIVVENDARVKVLRRRDAHVRTIYNAEERWLVLLVDYATENGPDGRVDMTQSYTGLNGDWPLEERWEGPATIESYSIAGEGGPTRVGLFGPRGLIQFLTQPDPDAFRDPAAIAVLSFTGAGGGGGGQMAFDDTERRQVEQVRANAARRGHGSSGVGSSSMSFGVVGGTPRTETVMDDVPTAQAPVRVGGKVGQPTKIYDVRPSMPAQAAQAGLRGVVILEITIDVDGQVKEARVLRSIHMLDEEAVRAVRKWRYEPARLNGKPVPVIITVTVPFP